MVLTYQPPSLNSNPTTVGPPPAIPGAPAATGSGVTPAPPVSPGFESPTRSALAKVQSEARIQEAQQQLEREKAYYSLQLQKAQDELTLLGQRLEWALQRQNAHQQYPLGVIRAPYS